MAIFLITGARTGVGREVARQLASNTRNKVLAVVRDLKADIAALRAIETQNGGRLRIVECDVSSPTSLSQLAADVASALGPGERVDVLINNAAILRNRGCTSLTTTAEDVLSHINTNVVGPALVVQTLVPLLAPGAVIANISSGIGSLTLLADGTISAEHASYSISKAALNMLTVHQAQNLKGRAIVACIDPGHVKTEMGGEGAKLEPSESAEGILSVLKSLNDRDSGKFFLYTGVVLPW